MGDINGKLSVSFGSSSERDKIGADSRGQLRFARLLAHDYRGQLLHAHGLGWHHWDGTRWATDEGEVVAKNAVIDLLTSEWANALTDHELQRDIKRCNSDAGITGILALAQVLDGIATRVADLDADPYLLNVANGTLDLHTLELRPHDPADRITKVCRAAYRPGERSIDWDTFLARSLPDADVRSYLARFLGVALIGEVIEQEFTVATGAGANGKGVFYEVSLHTVGDYGHTMDSELLTASRHGSGNEAKPGLIALRGRRFVVTSETEREVKLADALMKKLTGGDPIAARALYQPPIQFDPSHSLLMVTNHLPKVPGNDPAIWRRLRVIPFDVVIPEGERDPHLKVRLKLTALDAVLTWAVEGLADYRARGGMDAPEAVRAATADYQKRSDAIARFLDDKCMTNPHMTVPTADLWDAWTSWRNDDGAEEVSKREFSDELSKRGFPWVNRKLYGKTTRVRVGLGLQDAEEDGPR